MPSGWDVEVWKTGYVQPKGLDEEGKGGRQTRKPGGA